MSMFPITLIKGSYGSLSLSNTNGVISLDAEGSQSIGGGAVAGLIAPTEKISLPISLPLATHLVALLLEKEIPAADAAIEAGDALAEAAEKTL